MTNEEFSNEFDVLYNSITSNQAPGLDEYEKSVFLTKAQDEILKSYFDPTLNKTQKGFDGSERRQIDFSSLIRTDNLSAEEDIPSFDYRTNTKIVNLPTDILYIINEVAQVTRNNKSVHLIIEPLSYKEYNVLMSKPYKRPTKNKAWRVITQGSEAIQNMAEIIIGPQDTLSNYTIRYVKRPQAIILDGVPDLEGDVTLDDNKTGPQSCELDPILHPEILQRAVELAKAAYSGTLENILAVGNTSQTDIGIGARSK